jgi:hydroxymethylpyrimidine/phosphomethylpyrimidine kinase
LIRAVAEQLQKFNAHNIVLDPVMVAQSGDRLLRDDAVGAIAEFLMPLADVVTPNIPEAEVLVGRALRTGDELQAAASDLARHGSCSVLIKGGHLEHADSCDLLFLSRENRFVELTAERIRTRNNHGTGCTLSSAIAAHLAQGSGIEEAVRRAKEYINRAIRAGADYSIGRGHGPVHHFFQFWQ